MTYENMTLDELCREAYHSDNTLALEIIKRVDAHEEDVEGAYKEGSEEGYDIGYDQGYNEGYVDGQEDSE